MGDLFKICGNILPQNLMVNVNVFYSIQNEFEKIVNGFASTIKGFYLSETKILQQKLEQQNAEIKRLQTEYNETEQQQKQTISHLWDKNEDLKKTISDLEDSNEALRTKLQERESMSDTAEDVSYTSCEEETTFAHNSGGGSLQSGYSSTPNSQIHEKRHHFDLVNQVSLIYIPYK